MNKEERTRKENVMIFVIGVCDGLVKKGILEANIRLTEKGAAEYEALKATGFRPTDAEMHEAMRGMCRAAKRSELDRSG